MSYYSCFRTQYTLYKKLGLAYSVNRYLLCFTIGNPLTALNSKWFEMSLNNHQLQIKGMQAEVKANSDSLDESICATIWRDLKNIGVKLRYVIVPKFNMESDPEGVRELRNWDLWGPLLLCLLLSFILNITLKSNGNEFGVVFIVMWGGSFVVTINTKLLGGKISFFQCVCVLGYCIFPIVLGAALMGLLKAINVNFFLLRLLIAIACLIWSVMSSISFMNVIIDPKKNLIAIYPIFLFYLFIAWFLIFI